MPEADPEHCTEGDRLALPGQRRLCVGVLDRVVDHGRAYGKQRTRRPRTDRGTHFREKQASPRGAVPGTTAAQAETELALVAREMEPSGRDYLAGSGAIVWCLPPANPPPSTENSPFL